MRWAEHVACMEQKRKFWWGNLEAGGYLEDKGKYKYERTYSNKS
jgi:hypothetical protein